MGRRATPTPPPPPPPSLAPQSRYFLRNSTLTPEPTIKKEPFSTSPSPSPQCYDLLSEVIPHRTNDQLHHPTGVSVQETKSGMYTRLGAFTNNQTRHRYNNDGSSAYDWSSTSDMDDDGDTFSDEDAMVAFLERQELDLRNGFAFYPSGEKSLWPVQKTPPRTSNIPLMSNKRAPHSEQLISCGNDSEPDNTNTIPKVDRFRQSRKTHSIKRRHRGSSRKRTSSSAVEWLGLITLVGFLCFAALFVVTVFTSARRDSHQGYTLHGNITRAYRAPLQLDQKAWTWTWMTRQRVKDDDLPTLRYVQDLEHKLERVQQILQRMEDANVGQKELDHEDASPSNPRTTFSTLETKAISDMIEEALGADIVAKPDFALLSAGGRVLLHLTSDSYVHPRQPTLLGRLGAQFLVPPARPEKALQPSVLAGDCWAFQGDHGHLGIQLSRKIFVTDVTIEHVDPRVAMDIGSAPRQIEIWRLAEPVARRTGPSPSSSFEMHPPPPRQNSRETDEKLLLSPIKGSWRKSNAPVPGATLLTSFEYQIKSDNGRRVKRVQTFAIPEGKRAQVSTGIVVKILSNWGHAKHTCLYRVRVHGLEQ